MSVREVSKDVEERDVLSSLHALGCSPYSCTGLAMVSGSTILDIAEAETVNAESLASKGLVLPGWKCSAFNGQICRGMQLHS